MRLYASVSIKCTKKSLGGMSATIGGSGPPGPRMEERGFF